jgi:DNA-binding transcriptional MerR regulator
VSLAPPPAALRIGEFARRAGTTPRTVRYYEELGLLGQPGARRAGGHRTYSESDLGHMRELMRLRELLGLSLEELGKVTRAEEARALIRAEIEAGVNDPARLEAILVEALGHLEMQLALVARRQAELGALADDLRARRERVLGRLGR